MIDAPSIQDEIHQELNHYFASLATEWMSPLTFKMHTCVMCIRSTETTDINICAFITRDQQQITLTQHTLIFVGRHTPLQHQKKCKLPKSTTMISFRNFHLPFVHLSSWIVFCGRVSIVPVVADVRHNTMNHELSLTFCPFIIMDSICVGKYKSIKGEYCYCCCKCPR